MRLRRLVMRGFRNLADFDRELPAPGVAVLGANAQGKTNLLEAIYYPVLFRSFHGAPDLSVASFGGPGFYIETDVIASENGAAESDGATCRIAATYLAAGRKKRIVLGGDDVARIADAVGIWLAVAFLPTDVALASGPAAGRRQYLDRMLSLADRGYLRALLRYRAALAQRNSALRQGRADVARAFDGVLAAAGAEVMRRRLVWVAEAAASFASEVDTLGEPAAVRLTYAGRAELADPAAWPAALADVSARDRARGLTTVGPHRDDLVLEIGGHSLRDYGSTGQMRTAAIALKLLEIATLRDARRTEPVLLLDDIFAELDGGRQQRLARRLSADARQVFVTAPRRDELPRELDLPVWRLHAGHVEAAA